MGLIIKCGLALLVVLGVVLLLSGSVGASTDARWFTQPVKLLNTKQMSLTESIQPQCAGRLGVIRLATEVYTGTACIFGKENGMQLARYQTKQGVFGYAVSFAVTDRFYVVEGLCVGLSRCMYSQAADRLYIEHKDTAALATFEMVEGLRSQLRVARSGVWHYLPPVSSPVYLQAGGSHFTSGNEKMTADGSWVVFRYANKGYVRYNATTDTLIPLTSYANIPVYIGAGVEMTISDNGAWVAIVGVQGGVAMYKMTPTCGRAIAQVAVPNNEVLSCPYVVVPMSDIDRLALALYAPSLSPSGEYLQLSIARDSGLVRATYAPEPDTPLNGWYAAFGDSFTSGEGEADDSYYFSSTNTAENRCHVSKRSYPYLMGDEWAYTASNLACSGSRIEEVRKVLQTVTGNNKMPPMVISLGIGGNDIDVMGKLKTCIGVGTCEWVMPDKRPAFAREIKALFPRLVALIKEFQVHFPGVPVLVVGYPEVINATKAAPCSTLIGTLLNQDERRYMRETIRYLNTVIRAAAANTNTTYVDIEQAFIGERLCDERKAAMNGLRFGDDIAPIPGLEGTKLFGAESFHPTARGHYLSTQAMAQQLRTFWENPHCQNCTYSDAMLDPPEYWHMPADFETKAVTQYATRFIEDASVTSLAPIEYRFEAEQFKPGSAVKLEIHSSPRKLGAVRADADGSLRGTVTVPGDIGGYHTIHALGESLSGEPLDLYQTVFIEPRQQTAPVSQLAPKDTNMHTKTAALLGVSAAATGVSASGRSAHVAEVLLDVRGVNTELRAVQADKQSPLVWWAIGAGGVVGGIVVGYRFWKYRGARRHG